MSTEVCVTRDQTISSITALVAEEAPVESILDAIYEDTRIQMSVDRLGWAEIEPETHNVVARWTRSRDRTLLRRGFKAPILGSSLYFVMKQRKPRIMDDLLKYLENRPQSRSTRLITAEGVRSSLTCPLVCGEWELGFLFFSSFKANTFCSEDAPFGMAIANLLALAIKNAEHEDVTEEPVVVPSCETRHRLPIHKLEPGMILNESLKSNKDNLLLASGHELTTHSVARLREMHRAGDIEFAMVEVQ
ncbi:MAG TPA: hypothetical protein DDW52_21845 [Planctomycetaceae bacterium]|nr:hypothetical protein [Planctomycetaceae bacterium]